MVIGWKYCFCNTYLIAISERKSFLPFSYRVLINTERNCTALCPMGIGSRCIEISIWGILPPRASSSTGRTERWACNQQQKTGKTGKAEMEWKTDTTDTQAWLRASKQIWKADKTEKWDTYVGQVRLVKKIYKEDTLADMQDTWVIKEGQVKVWQTGQTGRHVNQGVGFSKRLYLDWIVGKQTLFCGRFWVIRPWIRRHLARQYFLRVWGKLQGWWNTILYYGHIHMLYYSIGLWSTGTYGGGGGVR